MKILILTMIVLLAAGGCQSKPATQQQSGRFGPPGFSASPAMGSFKPTSGSLGRPLDMGGSRTSPTAMPSSWRGFSPTGR